MPLKVESIYLFDVFVEVVVEGELEAVEEWA